MEDKDVTTSDRQVAIVGGNGQIARLLTPLLVQRGWSVTSVVRRAEQVDAVESLGGHAVIADIESIDARDLAPFLRGHTAVIFAAGAGYGSGFRRKRTVDYGGSVLSQQAALEAGVSRFVQISALVVGRPIHPESSHVWKEYVRAKADADRSLRETSLAWTIVRPGILTDGPGRGRITAARRLPDMAADSLSITRADVAAVVAHTLDLPSLTHKSFDVVAGSAPIGQVLSAL